MRWAVLFLVAFANAQLHTRDPADLTITPTPQKLSRGQGSYPLGRKVHLVIDDGTDEAAVRAAQVTLGRLGVKTVTTGPPGAAQGPGFSTIRIGDASRDDIKSALDGTAVVPSQAEGYALVAAHGGITIAGSDAAGQYYGVQTLGQLFVRGKSSVVPNVVIEDFPLMPLRGTIEGFYGEPWSKQARLDHVDWLGTVKANTYIYTPKDDEYLRAEWRDLYPSDKLRAIKDLIERSTANHVRFTYAVSPGVSVCFSSQTDRDAMLAKLQQVYDLGARAFSIPFDDISYTKWNCDLDRTTYGAPGQGAAGNAQVAFLNYVEENFIKKKDGTFPLQTVPTEYSDLQDTAYKTAMRERLDPNIVIQWTGTDVVPPNVTNDQAKQCAANFGRKVFLWDNYPVNDFGQTSGRLLLAPYKYREAGLHGSLEGLVGNPMNQAYASRVVLFSVADFAWNDDAFDADRSWLASLNDLASGDDSTMKALLILGDMEHEAPTFGPTPWQPSSPVLAVKIQKANATEHTAADLEGLATYAQAIAAAPATIRRGPVPAGFLVDVESWLQAMENWGSALSKTVSAQQALDKSDVSTAKELVAAAGTDVVAAKALRVTPAVNRWGSVAPILASGVLETYINDVANLAKAL